MYVRYYANIITSGSYSGLHELIRYPITVCPSPLFSTPLWAFISAWNLHWYFSLNTFQTWEFRGEYMCKLKKSKLLFTAVQSPRSQMSNDSFASSLRRFHTWKQLTADSEKWNIEKSCWKLSAKFSFRAWHLFTTTLCSSTLTLSNSPWIYFLRVVFSALFHKCVEHVICCFFKHGAPCDSDVFDT